MYFAVAIELMVLVQPNNEVNLEPPGMRENVSTYTYEIHITRLPAVRDQELNYPNSSVGVARNC